MTYTQALMTLLSLLMWAVVLAMLVKQKKPHTRLGAADRRQVPHLDTFSVDVTIEKRHYYGVLTDEEREPVSFLAGQLIMRPGASAIWHGTKLEERITIVAPRE